MGCVEIFEEHASGGNRARPVLARVLERVAKGDTLVVVRIDRLARSLSHLLEVGLVHKSKKYLETNKSRQVRFFSCIIDKLKSEGGVSAYWCCG